MIIKADTYEANEVLKFIRQNTNLTQEEFAKKLNKSKAWQQSNELGRSNYYFKDLQKMAKIYNFEIIIKEKWEFIVNTINSHFYIELF